MGRLSLTQSDSLNGVSWPRLFYSKFLLITFEEFHILFLVLDLLVSKSPFLVWKIVSSRVVRILNSVPNLENFVSKMLVLSKKRVKSSKILKKFKKSQCFVELNLHKSLGHVFSEAASFPNKISV